MLCGNLEWWDGVEGRGRWRGRGHMYTYGWFTLWQKPMQYCKAIIVQLKNRRLKRNIFILEWIECSVYLLVIYKNWADYSRLPEMHFWLWKYRHDFNSKKKKKANLVWLNVCNVYKVDEKILKIVMNTQNSWTRTLKNRCCSNMD